MMLIVGANEKLQLVTSAAGTIKVKVSAIEQAVPITTSSDSTPVTQYTTISTATTTDILAAAGANKCRNAKKISISNTHASVSNTVTLVADVSATDTEEHAPILLLPGETLVFVDGLPSRYNADGAIVVGEPEGGRLTVRTLASDQSNSTTTGTEVTGLSVALGVGIFAFRFMIRYQAAATTTGVKFGVNHTGTVGFVVANLRYQESTTAASTGAASQAAAGGTLHAGGSGRAVSTTGPNLGPTASVDTANADMLAIVEGLINVTVAGDFELWHASEVAAASTVKAGSGVMIVKQD